MIKFRLQAPMCAVIGVLCLGSVGCAGGHVDATDLPSTVQSPNQEPTPSPYPQDGNAPGPNPSPPAAAADACGNSNLTLCDDFEAEAVGANPNKKLWTLHTQNAQETLTIDSNRFYSGKQSLHIHTSNNGYESAEIINKSLFPAASNSFYGRFYMYLAQQPQIHTNLIRATGIKPGETATANLNYGGQFGPFLANYYDANNSAAIIDDWQHAGTQVNGVWKNATPVPTARWACIEYQFKGDTNEMHLWVDGQAIGSMDVLGKSAQSNSNIPWTAPPFTEVGLGYTVIQNSESFDHFDLWLDAVAFASQRIGCLPAQP